VDEYSFMLSLNKFTSTVRPYSENVNCFWCPFKQGYNKFYSPQMVVTIYNIHYISKSSKNPKRATKLVSELFKNVIHG